MEEVGAMHQLDSIEQRPQQAIELGLAGRTVETLKPCLEAGAALEAHHHIGGAVRLEDADHTDDRRMVELGERARLAKEA